MSDNYEGPGIYQHYKGGCYRAIGVARHESTGANMVIYHSYDIEHDLGRWMSGADFVARPLNSDDGDDAWNDRVLQRGSASRPRFAKVKGA